MNIIKHSFGSILLETLISIVILGLVVVGSIFSYSFVYQRIHSQRQQRIALCELQGWMELTITSLLDPDNPLNPNDLMGLNIEEILWQQFDNQFFFDPNKVDIDLLVDNNNNMATIMIRITPDSLSIPLFTQIYLERRR